MANVGGILCTVAFTRVEGDVETNKKKPRPPLGTLLFSSDRNTALAKPEAKKMMRKRPPLAGEGCTAAPMSNGPVEMSNKLWIHDMLRTSQP